MLVELLGEAPILCLVHNDISYHTVRCDVNSELVISLPRPAGGFEYTLI